MARSIHTLSTNTVIRLELGSLSLSHEDQPFRKSAKRGAITIVLVTATQTRQIHDVSQTQKRNDIVQSVRFDTLTSRALMKYVQGWIRSVERNQATLVQLHELKVCEGHQARIGVPTIASYAGLKTCRDSDPGKVIREDILEDHR